MDELVTWHDVARWLPSGVRDELELALPPEQRGWWTKAEAEADGGRFVEVCTAERAQNWLIRTGD